MFAFSFIAFGGTVVVIAIPALTTSQVAIDPADAKAGFYFHRDGTCTYTNSSGVYIAAGDWINPKSATIGDDYDLNVDVTSGTLDTASLADAVWGQVNASLQFEIVKNIVGTKTTTMTVKLRDRATLTERDSETVTLTATVDA